MATSGRGSGVVGYNVQERWSRIFAQGVKWISA
jgi:hypothetical protein